MNGASILMYHSVGDTKAFFTVPEDIFEKQIQFIIKKYTVISLEELFRRLDESESITGCVVITFDDGYLDNYEIVFSYVKKYKIPITIFVATAYIGGTMQTSEGITLPLMSKEMIKEMHESGLVEFMSHTHTHRNLDILNATDLEQELQCSEEYLHSLGVISPLPMIAYPRGRYSQKTIDFLKRMRWTGGLTVQSGLVHADTDCYKIPRNAVDSKTSTIQFKTILSSGIEVYTFLKNGR